MDFGTGLPAVLPGLDGVPTFLCTSSPLNHGAPLGVTWPPAPGGVPVWGCVSF